MTVPATLTLSDFLLARITEDEAAAQDAITRSPSWERADPIVEWGRDEDPVVLSGGKPIVRGVEVGAVLIAEHIARHDPARVLAECEAKRRILAIHSAEPGDPFGFCLGCDGGPSVDDCPNLHAIALPYADDPDFREEWRA